MVDQSNSANLSDTGKVRVLLVDDDELIQQMATFFLADSRYLLIRARDVNAAMEVIRTQPPDIIITDAMMPGESGYSFIQKLKANPATVRIPIILWTSLEDMSGRPMDSTALAEFSMSKPFYRSDILQRLQEAEELVRRRKAEMG